VGGGDAHERARRRCSATASELANVQVALSKALVRLDEEKKERRAAALAAGTALLDCQKETQRADGAERRAVTAETALSKAAEELAALRASTAARWEAPAAAAPVAAAALSPAMSAAGSSSCSALAAAAIAASPSNLPLSRLGQAQLTRTQPPPQQPQPPVEAAGSCEADSAAAAARAAAAQQQRAQNAGALLPARKRLELGAAAPAPALRPSSLRERNPNLPAAAAAPPSKDAAAIASKPAPLVNFAPPPPDLFLGLWENGVGGATPAAPRRAAMAMEPRLTRWDAAEEGARCPPPVTHPYQY